MEDQLVPFVEVLLKGVNSHDQVLLKMHTDKHPRILRLEKVNREKDDTDLMTCTVSATGSNRCLHDYDFKDLVFALVQGNLIFARDASVEHISAAR